MKICILGAGSLGCAIGGTLAEGGSDVHLIARSKAHVDAINRDGLKVREGAIDRLVNVHAATHTEGIGPVDLVIVLVKSFDTREAVTKAGTIIGERTVVASLQNGLGHEEIIADVVGKDRVLAGKTYVGGLLLGPGHVVAAVKGRETFIGELDGRTTERVVRIAEAFNRAGLATTLSTNIMGTMWDKLLVNVATGALAAITRLPYGALYRVPEVKACALAAVAEGVAVATASGVELSTRDPEDPWVKAAEGLPPEFKTSMLQSLEKGSRTEIDFINGSVVRWGEKCDVPTPVNRSLVACVKGIEYGMLERATGAAR